VRESKIYSSKLNAGALESTLPVDGVGVLEDKIVNLISMPYELEVWIA
jgi:hypothetical protein